MAPTWIQAKEVRSYCAAALLRDIELAKTDGIDDERLWTAHRNVNDRYRVQFTQTPKSKPVERRKLDTEYLRYIKAAQRFYRGYIYNLSTAYGGIKELQEVAEKVERGHSGGHVDSKQATDAVRERILRSCCTSLSQLGDLSRYRETQLPSKDRGPDWSHAVGYYELAQVIMPRSGLAQNQMAVVAIADNNNFRSVYYLYLSLLAMEPHPHAFKNLKKALYKIRSLRETGRMFQGNGQGRSGSHILRTWYLQLISNCFHGKGFAQQDQIEKEFLQHLESFIRSGLGDATVYKITLINIAAGHHARLLFERESESPHRMNSFLQFLRLNVKTLCVILRAFETELKQIQNSNTTPLMHKLLPTLRLYSAWLIQNGRIIAGATQLDCPSVQGPMWTMYARCLTLMVSVFPSATQLPEVPYLLEEDEATLGFAPLHGDGTKDIWLDANGEVKSRRREAQHTSETTNVNEEEHLTRVRYILHTGLYLAVQSNLVPIGFLIHDTRFFFDSTDPHAASSYTSIGTVEHSPDATISSDATLDSANPVSIVLDQDVEAARMVDDLVSDGMVMSSPASPPVGCDMSPIQVRHSSMLQESVCAPLALIHSRSANSLHGSPSPNRLGCLITSVQSQNPRYGPTSLSKSHIRLQPRPAMCSSPCSEDHTSVYSPFHTRMNSNESTISRSTIWATDHVGSLGVPLGNGTFGLDHEHATNDSIAGNHPPLGTGNVTWNTVESNSQASSVWATPEMPPQ